MHLSKTISGNDVSVQCHEALSEQGNWLLEQVQKVADEKGTTTVVRAGYRIQIGWSVVTLRAVAKMAFILLEPDFSEDPFHRFRDDVTCTLRVQAEQNDLSSSVVVEPIATSFQDKVIYSRGCLGERRIYLERKVPSPADSGWFIGPGNSVASNNRHEHYDACYAYELLKLRPEVMKVLQLPPGYLVVFDGTEIEAIVTPTNEAVYSR